MNKRMDGWMGDWRNGWMDVTHSDSGLAFGVAVLLESNCGPYWFPLSGPAALVRPCDTLKKTYKWLPVVFTSFSKGISSSHHFIFFFLYLLDGLFFPPSLIYFFCSDLRSL